jgi:hypothetical protein
VPEALDDDVQEAVVLACKRHRYIRGTPNNSSCCIAMAETPGHTRGSIVFGIVTGLATTESVFGSCLQVAYTLESNQDARVLQRQSTSMATVCLRWARKLESMHHQLLCPCAPSPAALPQRVSYAHVCLQHFTHHK